MMAPKIYVPKDDPPQRQWLTEHKGWHYWCAYWPTDGTQNSHPHDLTGIAWKDGVVMARRHLNIKAWTRGEAVVYTPRSHNPIPVDPSVMEYGIGVGDITQYTELTLPEPMERWRAVARIATVYFGTILPDLTHDRQVTPPWEWDDKPKIFNYWQHHRYKWKLRCLRHGISPKTQPWEVFWKAPDMAYQLLTKR